MNVPILNTQEDKNVAISRLQKEVIDFLGYESENIIFDYKQVNGHSQLDLITVNPRHNQSFLFHSTEGIDKVDSLSKMIDYLKTKREVENTYTIQWKATDEKEIHVSYFRAKNMYQGLDKLYFGRDMNTLIVYSIKLNPIS